MARRKITRQQVAKNIRRNGYIATPDGKPEHRVVYTKHFGKIPLGWVVHHIDFDKKNNNPENLFALPNKLHTKLHDEMAAGGFKYSRQQLEIIVKPYREQYEKMGQRRNEINRQIRELEKELRKLDDLIAS